MQRKKIVPYLFSRFSSIQIIVSFYFMAVLVAAILLSLPIFQKPGVHLSLIDILFTAVSTISVTGLSTIDLGETYNRGGIALLGVLFQLGSLGIMMVSTSFFILSKKRISLKQRQLIMTDMNQPNLSGIVRLIRNALVIIIGFQLVGGIILSLHFLGYYDSIKDALFYGFYTAVSAVTNSGADITGNSLMDFSTDYFVQFIVMFLIVVGGIGFPVLIWLLESSAFFKGMNFTESAFYSMFYSVSTRNAGLVTTPISNFSDGTLLLFSVLMFIGASPSSVGGGVRTTTLAIVVLYLFSFIRSRENINIFGRRIHNDDVKKSIVVLNLSIALCFFSVLVLSVTEKHSLISIIVEVSSAFGTTGLSMGITSSLSIFGQLVIILLMFIGRVGMLYMLMLLVPKEKEDLNYLYPTEKIIIG
ncbi:TrkH family potassium uptake protein [Carnobacterium divergens]|uniref:TrkH family potassium uptake protein n=1 Tax=Carnobacterium divergens TaxID=2748 RepID=UPI0028900B25|nr:potassium transporter TrkG [Carnobacterium divergens]MDT1995370.1 TrkH family potassium uptake protein [Carnobacterium divergens]